MPRFVHIEELFKGRHFDQEIVVLCVRWYLSYKDGARAVSTALQHCLAYDAVLMKGEDCERESEETMRDVLFYNPASSGGKMEARGTEPSLPPRADGPNISAKVHFTWPYYTEKPAIWLAPES
jgi:hypothetical protein